jgi:hypothetical protein
MTNKEELNNDTGSVSAVPKAEWTIMIYMAGDNNLSDDCVNALKPVQNVKTGDLIHVIAQFDPADTRVGSQRVVMNHREKKSARPTSLLAPDSPSKLSKDYVKFEEGPVKFDKDSRQQQKTDPAETDTADPKTLFDFISWSVHTFPAKHYMLLLAGHAGGIEDGYLLKDENPVSSMSLNGLMQVLRRVKEGLKIQLDILGMDSCLMSMIEICYELSKLDVIDMYVSSQSMTPNPGWPYGQIVEALFHAGGKTETEELAATMVNRYINSYVENAVCSGLSTDLAAVKLAATPAVVDEMRNLGRVLRARMGNGSGNEFNRALVHAHWEAQSFNGERFVDLRDLCDLLEKYCRDDDVTTATENVRATLKSVVLSSCFCGIDYQYSYGLSVYFPWSTIFAYYGNLDFAKESGADWLKFLDDYVEKTRREPRGGDGFGPRHNYKVFRKVPPYSHGPTLPATSMRNPPRKWSTNGISDCMEDKKQWFTVFESFK